MVTLITVVASAKQATEGGERAFLGGQASHPSQGLKPLLRLEGPVPWECASDVLVNIRRSLEDTRGGSRGVPTRLTITAQTPRRMPLHID